MLCPYLLTRSSRRRRTVALRVRADGQVEVQAPLRTSLSWIESFLKGRAGWIEKRRRELSRAPAPLSLENGSTVPFQGEAWTVRFCTAPTTQSQGQEQDENKTVLLYVPPGLSPSAHAGELQTALTLWYKHKARRVFKERLTHWAGVMGLKPGRLIVTAPTARWGSCNAKNEIRLNYRLIKAPPALLDYVVVHELAHIPHKNHGPRFWARVGRTLPHYRALRAELRAFEKGPGALDILPGDP